ncbi:MAG: hypothetical protein GY788_25425, partial [bacterium]|nr:hypothetical protein [bacterium]
EDITQQRDEYPEGLTEPDDEDITQQRDEYPEGLTEPDDEDITQQHDEDPEGLTEPDDEDGATQPLDDTEPTQQDQEAAALDEPTPAIIIEGSQGMEEVDLTPPATEDSVQSAVVADPAESSSAIELAAKQLSAELAEALGEADDISQPVDDEDDTAPLDGDASEPSAVDTPITELANEEITEPAVDETDIEAVEAEGPAPVLEDDSGAEQVGDEAEEWPEAEIVPAATDQDTSEQRIDEIEEQTKPPAEVTAPPPAVAAPILVFGVDINEADAGAFADFPGIGPRLARLIVAYRDKRGPFGSPGELLNLLRAYEANQKDRTQ